MTTFAIQGGTDGVGFALIFALGGLWWWLLTPRRRTEPEKIAADPEVRCWRELGR